MEEIRDASLVDPPGIVLSGGNTGSGAIAAADQLLILDVRLDTKKVPNQSGNYFDIIIGTWTGVFKAARDIHRSGGVQGLFQGNSATVLRIFPYAAIKFMAYEQYRSVSVFGNLKSCTALAYIWTEL